MRVSWLKLEELIEFELQQAGEEGLDVRQFAKVWDEYKAAGLDLLSLRAEAERLLADMATVEANNDDEPTDYKEILAQLPSRKTNVPWAGTEEELFDKIWGGWLGRAAGCLLGKPVEGKPREWIRELLESTGRWPLDNYFTAEGVPEHVYREHTWHKSYTEALRENIVCMPEDDDLNYPMLNLYVAETFGPDFRPADVLQSWLVKLPVLQVFTAERVAYFNALKYMTPPETAVFQNPYREWIGAQIRADFWGWIAPGNPGLAVELAYRDASISHVKNGIYGAMFVAAMLSAAFVVDTPQQAVHIGLQYVPPQSRLAEAIRYVGKLRAEVPDFEAAVDLLYEKYGHYHWVHTINNAALVVAALLYGDNDFEKTIAYAVMGGWDTDCNGATVGSVLGVIHGGKALPDKWIGPLNDTIRTSLHGFDRSSFQDLAKRTMAQRERFLRHDGR